MVYKCCIHTGNDMTHMCEQTYYYVVCTQDKNLNRAMWYNILAMYITFFAWKITHVVHIKWGYN